MIQAETPKSKGRSAKRKRKMKLRRIFPLMPIIALIVLIGAYFLVSNLGYFDIVGIAVAGNSELSDEEIVEISGINEGDSIFSFLPFVRERRIEKEIYIDSCDIHLNLPNTVEIVVRERVPAAQLEMDEGYAVIDEEGNVMEVAEDKKDVTLIKNVNVKSAQTGREISVDENENYETAMKIIAAMDEGDMYFKSITADGTWITATIYGKLKCKGRYANIMDSLNSGELKTVVYALYQDGTEKGTINVGSNSYCSFTP